MMQSIVVTLIGPNKAGIINSVSQVVTDHSANWLDSQFANYAGQFAGIVHIEVADSDVSKLQGSLVALQSEHLQICVVVSEPSNNSDQAQHIVLELVGQDHPGIIRDISEALASNNISIEELETELINGSMSGENMFQATARLSMPPSLSLDELDDILHHVSEGLMLDVVVDAEKA